MGSLTGVAETAERIGEGLNGIAIGRIAGLTPEGQALVDFPGNRDGPVAARTIVMMTLSAEEAANGPPVLLYFEGGDLSLPIILGVVGSVLSPATESRRGASRDTAEPRKALVLEAREEIALYCGRSSMMLRKDGKIVVKGANIVSRASGSQKIKGATVNIN